ncbi:MAG: hypothetical protein J2P18_06000 [Nocardia sp.]|nr:hypothetical protein [Nocardia sp.]
MGTIAVGDQSEGRIDTDATGLPGATRLEHACRGLPLIGTGAGVADVIVEIAGELGELHRERLVGFGIIDVDQRRRSAIAVIDVLVSAAAPAPSLFARLRAETVGAVVDRLASWCALLGDAVPIMLSDKEIDNVRAHVSALCDSYTDLIDELARGLCRLPAAASLTSPPRVISACHCGGTALEGTIE